MTTPKDELIFQNRLAALQGISSASYNYDYAEISGAPRPITEVNEYPAIFVMDGTETPLPDSEVVVSQMGNAIKLIIFAYVDSEQCKEELVRTARRKAKQDVLKALWQDPTCGGLGILRSAITVESDEGIFLGIVPSTRGAVRIEVEIEYRKRLSEVAAGTA